MIEDLNSAEEDDNLFMIFSVFDPEHNGFIEGKHIKKSLLTLTDVPLEEVDEIIEKARITDDRKISLEGEYIDDVIIRSNLCTHPHDSLINCYLQPARDELTRKYSSVLRSFYRFKILRMTDRIQMLSVFEPADAGARGQSVE